MNCESCSKEITSKITGSLCTACYFKAKNDKGKESASTPVQEKENIAVKEETEQEDYLCSECNERHPIPTNGKERKCIVVHAPSKSTATAIAGIKYCQSCIERGYGLNIATREWRPDYFICDDCFQPLLENLISVPEQAIADKVKEIKGAIKVEAGPILKQVYDLLGIPEALRFSSSDSVLRARNDIFNYHATSLVNKPLEEIVAQIEELSVLLFQVKIALEPKQDYINRVKHSEREKAQLLGLEKSEKEYTKGPSKIKLSKDEKMAKQLGVPLEKYLQMVKETKQMKFDKIVNG